jgi:hypothetical protein
MKSSYQDLKMLINSKLESAEKWDEVDSMFQKIIQENQEDIIPSLDLIQNYLIEALNENIK